LQQIYESKGKNICVEFFTVTLFEIQMFWDAALCLWASSSCFKGS